MRILILLWAVIVAAFYGAIAYVLTTATNMPDPCDLIITIIAVILIVWILLWGAIASTAASRASRW